MTKTSKYQLWEDSAGAWRLRVADTELQIGYFLYKPTPRRVRKVIKRHEKLAAEVDVIPDPNKVLSLD